MLLPGMEIIVPGNLSCGVSLQRRDCESLRSATDCGDGTDSELVTAAATTDPTPPGADPTPNNLIQGETRIVGAEEDSENGVCVCVCMCVCVRAWVRACVHYFYYYPTIIPRVWLLRDALR